MKTFLTDDQKGSIMKYSGFDAGLFSNYGSFEKTIYGATSTPDYPDSFFFGGEVPSSTTELASYTVPDGYIAILDTVNLTNAEQKGQAIREIVLNVKAAGDEAGTWSMRTTASQVAEKFAIVPALVAGSVITVNGYADSGSALTVNGYVKLLLVSV